jgi:predicted metal-binding integral membrane protein DUF2182
VGSQFETSGARFCIGPLLALEVRLELALGIVVGAWSTNSRAVALPSNSVGPGKSGVNTTWRPSKATPSELPSLIRKPITPAHQPWSMISSSCTPNQQGQNMLQLQDSIIWPFRFWALMASLFALGVMSVGWMVFVVALIAVEKLLPWKAVAR